MNWTLSELASIAEILGLIAIFPSLIFVGVQLARSSREARAATLQAAASSQLDLTSMFAQYASTWDKVLKGEALSDGEESRRGIVLYQSLMIDTENRFHQNKTGYLEDKSWKARELTLPHLISLPMFASWRGSLGGLNCSSDFLEVLDKLADEIR